MGSLTARQVFIQGITLDGRTFRPSDWAERLAGVMSQFRPGGARPGSHLGYSPWCVPTTLGSVKCVVVHSDLQARKALLRLAGCVENASSIQILFELRAEHASGLRGAP